MIQVIDLLEAGAALQDFLGVGMLSPGRSVAVDYLDVQDGLLALLPKPMHQHVVTHPVLILAAANKLSPLKCP